MKIETVHVQERANKKNRIIVECRSTMVDPIVISTTESTIDNNKMSISFHFVVIKSLQNSAASIFYPMIIMIFRDTPNHSIIFKTIVPSISFRILAVCRFMSNLVLWIRVLFASSSNHLISTIFADPCLQIMCNNFTQFPITLRSSATLVSPIFCKNFNSSSICYAKKNKIKLKCKQMNTIDFLCELITQETYNIFERWSFWKIRQVLAIWTCLIDFSLLKLWIFSNISRKPVVFRFLEGYLCI